MKKGTARVTSASVEGRRGNKGKRRVSWFWILYILFVVGMIAFWIWVGHYVRESLVRYELSQPENTMEEIMTEFRTEGLEQYLSYDGEVSRFETREQYEKLQAEQFRGKILFYLTAKGYQDPSAPKYELFADGEHFGYCTLKEISSEPFFLNLLKMSKWALDKVEIDGIVPEKSVTVTVPDSCQVLLNGILLDERERGEEVSASQEFTYVAAYVEVPRFVSYRVDGLLQEPEIEVRTREGRTVFLSRGGLEDGAESAENSEDYEIAVTQNTVSISAKGFSEGGMPSELAEMVLEQTERYTNFFSVDLPGCRGSVAPIADMFPSDSYYLDLADTYRREDMWMYSSHNAPVFKNESVDHYIRYSDDLFSCEVYFDKEMLLHKTGKIKVDTTNFRLYYGLLDGEWKILDMVTLLGAEE